MALTRAERTRALAALDKIRAEIPEYEDGEEPPSAVTDPTLETAKLKTVPTPELVKHYNSLAVDVPSCRDFAGGQYLGNIWAAILFKNN